MLGLVGTGLPVDAPCPLRRTARYQ